MTANLSVTGAMSPFGVRYIGVQQHQFAAWVSGPAIAAGDKTFLPILAAQGVTFASKKAIDELKEQWGRLSDYPATAIATASGWNGEAFALIGGEAVSAHPHLVVPIAFATEPRKTLQAGTLRQWRRGVATLLATQPLGAMGLGAAFVPPLLDFMPDVPNVTLAIVGTEGIGKTSLLQAIGSVYGGTGAGGTGQYLETFAIGTDALPRRLAAHRHHLLILDAANVLQTSPDKRAAAKVYHHLGHDLAQSEVAGGTLRTVGTTYRGWVLMAANESLRAMAELPPMPGEQIVNLTVPSGWAHGAFPTLPDNYRDGGAYAEALVAAARMAHGTAIRAFLRRLVVDMRDDRPALERKLRIWQASFLTACGVDRNIGRDLRGARVFAATYAALRLAKAYRVLPRSLKPRSLILACYRLYQADSAPEQPFLDRLRALAASDRVVAVSKKADMQQADRVRDAIATLHDMGDGYQLRIPLNRIREAFPDWDRIKRSNAVKAAIVGEKGKRPQLKSKAKLAPGFPEERLFCFRLPYPEPSLLAADTDESRPEPATGNDSDWIEAAAAE